MLPIMQSLQIDTICFSWMAHIGWLRTSGTYPERGGAKVTEFNMADFRDTGARISADELWANYAYFVKAVIPEAEKYGIKLALHPDDPPVPRLGDVERIMISKENIKKAVYGIAPSESLGITMCQANYYIMGENLESTIKEFADKIYLVHFRNTTGAPEHFRETFHDNGDIDMARIMKCYVENGVNAPVRVDHVPTMAGERSTLAGYDALGRLFAIGYLKGILDGIKA
jgi:mannonate dehydratase